MIEIRPLHKTDPVKAFRNFICELIDENAYLLIDKKPTMKEEKAWLKDKLDGIRKSNVVFLTAWNGKKLIGLSDGFRGKWKDKQNVCLGIAVLKSYRGQGLGERLLNGIIKLAKQKLKPRIMYLSVAAPNKPALKLYKKIGFKTFARFPKWSNHSGKYIDTLYMKL